MAWQHGDSYNYLPNTFAGISAKWDDVHNSVSIGTGRGGSNGCFCLSSGGTNGWVTKNVVNTVTGICGSAFSFSNSSAAQRFMWFMDAGTIQIALDRLADGTIKVYRVNAGQGSVGTGTLLGSSASGVLATANTFYYVETKVKIDNTTGTVEVRVNGSTTPVINLTDQDTQATGNAFYTQVSIGASGTSGVAVTLDDTYMLDSTTSDFNTWLGDIHYESPVADGNGTQNDFTPSAGSNYQNVDEATPNNDTDYNSSTTVGHKDLYQFAAMATSTGSILGVIVNCWDRKDDSGDRTHSALAYLSGTESESAAWSPGTGYLNHQGAFASKPGGGAWTIDDVNAAEFGMKVAS